MLFDTHAHLYAGQFDKDREAMIERAFEAGVSRIVVVGIDEDTIPLAIDLAEKYESIYATVGWHPKEAIHYRAHHLDYLRKMSEHEKVVALGEMGLDYYWDTSPKDVQHEVFREQIRLAKEVDLPIIIHNRESTDDVIRILQEEDAGQVGGIIHCYSSTVENLDVFLDMNFYISLAGPVTFKNAQEPKEVAKHIPLERLLIETDAPYLAPHPYRGKRNEPAYVTKVAEEIATLRGMDYDEICQITTNNALDVYRINE